MSLAGVTAKSPIGPQFMIWFIIAEKNSHQLITRILKCFEEHVYPGTSV